MKNFDRRDEIAFEVEHDASECEVSEAALQQPFGLGALLREEVEGELEKRDGQWSAFTAQVFRRVDQAELAAERMSLEERAIDMMRAEVDGELAEMMPRFDRAFKDGIEQRIWDAAREQPSLGARISEWLSSWKKMLAPRPLGLAMAAAAAIVVAVTFNPLGVQNGGEEVAIGNSGSVSVDRVDFEGTVTVMSEDGLTVVWLADDATS